MSSIDALYERHDTKNHAYRELSLDTQINAKRMSEGAVQLWRDSMAGRGDSTEKSKVDNTDDDSDDESTDIDDKGDAAKKKEDTATKAKTDEKEEDASTTKRLSYCAQKRKKNKKKASSVATDRAKKKDQDWMPSHQTVLILVGMSVIVALLVMRRG